MSTWTCPDCGRTFGRRNQSHGCAPPGTVDGFFAGRPPAQREIFDAVVAHLHELGPVVVDAVAVGVFLKRTRTFAEVRGTRNGVVLELLLSRLVEHPRITKTIRTSANRVAHFIPLTKPAGVDDQVREWLTEAYVSSPE